MIEQKREKASAKREFVASTRVSPGSYASVLFIVSFVAAFLIYLEEDTVGILLFGLAIVLFPLLALSDRVGFDGKRLHRTGLLDARSGEADKHTRSDQGC